MNIKRHLIICEKTQEKKEGCSFFIQDAEGNIRGSSEPFMCTMEELCSSKFTKIIEEHVIYGTGREDKNEARRVCEYIIKMECKAQDPEVIYQREFGWNGNVFWWEKEQNIEREKEYANAISVCILLTKTISIPAVILASIHGVLEKLLQDAGIGHNFVTYLVGGTGLGKSALLKAVCNYHTKAGNIISMDSDHKSIKKVLENRSDMTIVVDDFCKTKSDRISSSQLQIVSEIIQASSDGARVLVDESSVNKLGGQARQHIAISAEQVINNESTMNRCFPVCLTEALPEKTFLKIKDMEKNLVFYQFLVAFSKYVGGENYAYMVAKVEADYKSYCVNVKQLGECTKGSDNRINNTYAVQMVIAQILMKYLTDLNVNSDLLNKVENNLKSSICAVCRNLKHDIMVLHKQETHKTYLEPLCEIVMSMAYEKHRGLGSRYHLAKTEKKFSPQEKYPYDAFCIRNDYISFDGKHICNLLERDYGIEGANSKGLSSDLQHYSLAHVDKEGKLSCRWGTKGRYYHVRVTELLDLIKPDLHDMLREHIINIFNICE